MEKKMNRKRQLNETEQLKPLRKALLVTHVSGFVPPKSVRPQRK